MTADLETLRAEWMDALAKCLPRQRAFVLAIKSGHSRAAAAREARYAYGSTKQVANLMRKVRIAAALAALTKLQDAERKVAQAAQAPAQPTAPHKPPQQDGRGLMWPADRDPTLNQDIPPLPVLHWPAEKPVQRIAAGVDFDIWGNSTGSPWDEEIARLRRRQ